MIDLSVPLLLHFALNLSYNYFVSDLIKYPNRKNLASDSKKISFANRGKTLEDDLNQTNEYYRSQGIAVIHKKPTPIQIVQVDYQKRSTAKITEAYFKTPSTTDYNGVYRGYYLDFEAKECKSSTSFPLSQIHAHQIKHLQEVISQKGIAFIIIRFTRNEEDYCVLAKKILDFQENTKRKSLPKEWIITNGNKIDNHYHLRIDYLKVIDTIIKEELLWN